MEKEERKELTKNIKKYYWFKVFSNLCFFVPIIVLFFQDNGLSLTQILLLQSFFSIMIILLEVPTGALADYISRKFSLVSGGLVLFIGAIVYGSGSTFVQFLVAEALWAFGSSLISGADTAILYDSLKGLNKEKSFKRIQGKALYYFLIAGGFASIIGGFIGKYSFRATWYMSGFAVLVYTILASRFKEPKKSSDVEMKRYWDLIFESVKFIRKHKLVRWYIFFFSLVGLSGMIVFWMSQPYMQQAGLDIAYFGFVFFFFNIVAAISSKYSYKIEKALGAKGILYFIAFLATVPLFFIGGFIFKLGFLLLAIYQIIRGISSPVFDHMLLKYTYSDKRATVLSLKNLIYRLVYAVLMPLFGVLTDTYSLGIAFILSGIFFTIGLIIFFIIYIRIPGKYFRVKRKKMR